MKSVFPFLKCRKMDEEVMEVCVDGELGDAVNKNSTLPVDRRSIAYYDDSVFRLELAVPVESNKVLITANHRRYISLRQY